MTLKRLVPCAALLLAVALPASASAQLQVAPPGGDDVTAAIDLGTLSPSPSVFGFDADTSSYTLQPDLGEFNQCGDTQYDKTVWAKFKTPRTGQIDITAAGFDGVIGLSRQTSTGLAPGPCTNRLKGRIESFRRDSLPTVKKGGTYYVQVGGAQQPGGSFASGPTEVAVELLKPKVVSGADAGLAYKFNKPHGITITSLRIDGPPGSTILIFCAKKCGKQGRFSVKGKAALLRQPIQKLQFGKRAEVGGPFRAAEPKKADDAPLYSAAKQVFKGRKIKNGNTVFVAVVAPDQIGEIFFWKVKKSAAGPKQLGCIEPNSSRVKAIGKCNGS